MKENSHFSVTFCPMSCSIFSIYLKWGKISMLCVFAYVTFSLPDCGLPQKECHTQSIFGINECTGMVIPTWRSLPMVSKCLCHWGNAIYLFTYLWYNRGPGGKTRFYFLHNLNIELSGINCQLAFSQSHLHETLYRQQQDRVTLIGLWGSISLLVISPKPLKESPDS